MTRDRSVERPRDAPSGKAVARGSLDRLLEAAIALFRRQGYEGTAVKDIAREGEAPMGSFYYHFPLGKEQLGAAAVRRGADQVARLYLRAMERHTDPAEALAAIPLRVADVVERSGWEAGCPVAATALETVGRVPALQRASVEAFDQWEEVIAGWLLRAGCDAPAAGRLALETVCLVEGAELVARVRGTREPLERAAEVLRRRAREEWPTI
jgi:TetR/AcrR family transcriptional repressor of lmrAB and yxaGH operons